MRKLLITIAALSTLISCTVAPERLGGLSPADCQLFGVNVSESATPTGRIVHSEFKTLGGVRKACGGEAGGCVRGVSGDWLDPNHDYAIYYSDHKCMPEHEACHALYEVSAHTDAFMARIFTGDKFAACPLPSDNYVFRNWQLESLNPKSYFSYRGW